MTMSSVSVGDANASDLLSALTAKAAQSADSQVNTGARGFDYYLQAKETAQANNLSQATRAARTTRTTQAEQDTQRNRTSSRKEKEYQRTSDDDNTMQEKRSNETTKPAEKSVDKTASRVNDNNDDRKSDAATQEETDKKIVSTVADALGVPEETVMQWLAQLQLQPADLTDPQAVTALLQKAFGVDEPAMLLTEPAFPAVFDAINEAMAAYRSLADTAAMSDTMAALQDLTVITDETNDTVVVTSATANATATAALAAVEADGPDVQAEVLAAEIPAETAAPVQGMAQGAAQQQTGDTGGQMAQDGKMGEVLHAEAEGQPIMTGNLSFESAAARVMEAANTRTASPVDATSVIEQIMSRVRMQSGSQFAELKITLRPENLGDVTLRVLTLNGVVTAQFIAENQRVKEVLESNFNQLRDVLQEQGVNISELSVSVGQEEGDERMNQFLQAQQSGRRRLQRITNRGIEAGDAIDADMDRDAAPMADMADVLLNSVDFTA